MYDPNPENPFLVHTEFVPPPIPQHELIDPETRALEDTGVYELDNNGALRAFITPSPTREGVRRPRTSVDLILPPKDAFDNNSQFRFQSSYFPFHRHLSPQM